MRDSRATALLDDQQALAGERAIYESAWAEVTRYCFPRGSDFGRAGPAAVSPARLQQPELNDTTAGVAASRAAAFLESALTPRGQRWHHLRTVRDEVGRKVRARRWLEEARDSLHGRREEPGARFSVEVHEVFLSLACYGTGCLSLEERPGGAGGFLYRAVPLAELFVAEGAAGGVDKVHRRYRLSARAALQRFGADLPPKLVEVANKEPGRWLEFLHCVKPREESAWGRRDFKGMPFASHHLSVDEGALVRESGYRTLPYLVSRLMCAPGEVYGRGLAMAALPTIKMLNRLRRSIVNGANREVEPPYLSADDDLPAPRLTPNAINHGYLSAEGKPLLVPLQTGGVPRVGLDLLQAEAATVQDHFLVSLFDLLVKQPKMTATEVLERAQERGIMLAPIVGQQQDELLGPCITRELDLSFDRGDFPPLPPELELQPYVVQYDTSVTRALKAGDGVAVMRTLEALLPYAQAKPEALDVLHPAKTARVIADSFGVPAECLMSDEELAQLRAANEAAARQARLLEAAKVVPGAVAGATRAEREARQLGGGAPEAVQAALSAAAA